MEPSRVAEPEAWVTPTTIEGGPAGDDRRWKMNRPSDRLPRQSSRVVAMRAEGVTYRRSARV